MCVTTWLARKPEAGFIDSEHCASIKKKTSALVYNEKVMNCY